MTDLLEVSKKKYIGHPLESLIGKGSVFRGGYRLNADGDVPTGLGKDYSLDRLIKANSEKTAWTIVKIDRYYDEIIITIAPPEEVSHV